MRVPKRAFPGRVFFDHLPKTAGVAINLWLVESLGSGCVTPTVIGSHRDLIRQYGGRYSVISGHIHFQDGDRLDPRYQYITLLRNPVDRVISWLYFVINDHDISHPPYLLDMAKRFIDSDGQDMPDALIGYISNLYVEHFCRIEGNGAEREDEKLARALAAIQKYDVVGMYEDMPNFLADVAVLIGIPSPKAIARVNTTTQRPAVDQISAALRERIVDLNRLDMRFYEEVVAWKTSIAQTDVQSNFRAKRPQWQKYEAVPNRVATTPDLIIGPVVLREGHDIRHGQLMTFDVNFFLPRDVQELETGIHILDSDRRWAFGINSTLLGQSHENIRAGSYRVSHHVIADLPTGAYTAGFAFAERSPEGQRELAWHDLLCEFQVYHEVSTQCPGYAYLPAQISLCSTGLAVADSVVTRAAGSLLVPAPVASMVAGMQTSIGVEIVNRSEQAWVGGPFRPINLSYHWLKNSGRVLHHEGLRTPLPAGGVGPGRSLEAEMLVEAPNVIGQFTLILTLVQEHVSWFEKMGFQVARLKVNVTDESRNG